MSQLEQRQRPGGLRDRPAYALSLLQQLLISQIERDLGGEGLNLRAHQVLACVDYFGGGSQQQVCNSMAVDRSEMVRIVDRLEKAGLLQRDADPADRRRHRLRLTAAGRLALKRGDRLMIAATQQTLSRLSNADRSSLNALVLRALGQE
jgi:DNA-binding MarR family transcriptional regulator